MTESRLLIWKYYLFRMTNSAGFYVPVAILYLKDQGYSVEFILFSYAVFAFASLAAEIPTGYLGDWLGRRESLAVGSITRAVVLVAYPLVGSQIAYLGLHVIWAIGRAFRSGTQDAWLYELLQKFFDEDEFARIESRGSSVLLVTSAFGAVVGGFLYTVNQGFPFFTNAGLALLGIPLLLMFPSVETRDGENDVFTVREAVHVLRLQTRRPEVRWLVVYAALFNALFLVTRIYEQPALDSVGIPVVGLGFLYAAFKLVSAGAASTAGWLNDNLGARGVFVSLAPIYGVAYAAIYFFPLLVVPALFLNRGLTRVVRPIRNQYLNDRLENVGRATVLSGAAMVLSFAGVVARLVSGWASNYAEPTQVLAWAGVILAVAGAFLWLAVSPVRPGVGTERKSGSTQKTPMSAD